MGVCGQWGWCRIGLVRTVSCVCMVVIGCLCVVWACLGLGVVCCLCWDRLGVGVGLWVWLVGRFLVFRCCWLSSFAFGVGSGCVVRWCRVSVRFRAEEVVIVIVGVLSCGVFAGGWFAWVSSCGFRDCRCLLRWACVGRFLDVGCVCW